MIAFFSGGTTTLKIQAILFATLATCVAAFAQNPITADSPFQVRYASNLGAGDSVINITNTGARGAANQSGTTAGITGAICANVYAFSADEQLVSCCSCPVTPNGLVSLSVKSDLISNTLTPAVPTSVVVKIVATVPTGGTCNSSAATVGLANGGATLSNGLAAWGTTLHAGPTGAFGVTETAFTPATLSTGEANRLGSLCTFIINNGSGFGICRSCRLGGLGASQQ